MKTTKKRFLFLALSFAVILQPVLLSGLKESSNNQENPQHIVSVILKLLQVYVVDKEGNPVTGLTGKNFEIFQDGKRMEIEAFEKHVLPVFEKKATAEQAVGQQEKPIFPLLNRKFYILIDYYRNDSAGIEESKEAALHFVKKNLQPGDEAAVLSYSNIGGFNIHCFLTKDQNKVISVLAGLKLLPEEIDWEFMQARPMRPYDDSGMGSVPMYTRFDPEHHLEAAKALDFAEGLRKLMKSMSLIPGNKNIIFFSQGITRKLMRSQDYGTQMVEKYTEMARELADIGAPVFTVNSASGRNTMKSIYERGDDSLQLMSKFSGGKYFEKAAYTEKISEDIQKITGNYYVLGYSIDEKWDGRYHEIKVKVEPNDYTVYCQGGYYNPKPYADLTSYEKQLQLIELVFNPDPYFHDPISLFLEALPVVFKGQPMLAVLSQIP
ncbi:MAG: VWA domain-containing protein, partial [Candidatus Aminicenantes bacterium]|nr:VWA domain-containing protein [Candidatus Aminicenantes bacterium]